MEGFLIEIDDIEGGSIATIVYWPASKDHKWQDNSLEVEYELFNHIYPGTKDIYKVNPNEEEKYEIAWRRVSHCIWQIYLKKFKICWIKIICEFNGGFAGRLNSEINAKF